jgi:O-methyltransferase domain/Dimerisation domain
MLAMEKEMSVAPQEAMLGMIGGFWVARSIYLAAKLGIADCFEDQSKSIEQIASETDSDPRSLYRLMRALASVGIFSEVSPQWFALTPLAATLQTNAPGSMRYAAMAQMGYDHSLGWSNGIGSLKTGEIAFETVTGMSIWDHYAQHPEDGMILSQSMSNMGTATSQAIAATYDFSQFKTIVDVGGAQGSLLSTILQANPTLNGILFDLPEIVANVQLEGMNAQPVAGNFFESVPSGGDAYLLRWIIHDWNDEKASTILRNCHQAMPAHGKLMLFEGIVPEGNEPSPLKFVDLIMLWLTGGRERTEEEYRSLLRSNGFELTRVIPTPSMFSIIEAVKL